ncbi:MAG: hypothetical protein KGJ43_03320 [Acidobacteriota bacterium]|nr:hypothetical protein [Acidobacteriota bacterium]
MNALADWVVDEGVLWLCAINVWASVDGAAELLTSRYVTNACRRALLTVSTPVAGFLDRWKSLGACTVNPVAGSRRSTMAFAAGRRWR